MNEAESLQKLRACLEERLGLNFPPGQEQILQDLLERNAGRRNWSEYLEKLGSEEFLALAQQVTVGETMFFRHWHQLECLVQVAVPDRLKARQSARRLNILSAACSSGEEPYSLSMLLRQNFTLTDWTVQILALDLNRRALKLARQGVYSKWSLRETPANFLQRWFVPKAEQYRLDENILRSVQFEERNLHSENPDLWLKDRWDIIFCRNMLMYLTPEAARQLVQKFSRSLSPGGYLFLGPAENLRGVSDDFTLHYRDQAFFYQRSQTQPAQDPPPPPPPVTARPAPRPQADRRAEEIRELLDQERYALALELLEALPPAPDISLWKASILLNSGNLAAAEELGHSLRLQRATEAGSHLIIGLCRQEVGDLGGARQYLEQAAQLDPGLALARLHLGMLARRQGLTVAARKHLRQAQQLLTRESEERLRVFGGGFRRQAWQALCQSELQRCTSP